MSQEKLNGISLFAGVAGIDVGLREYVRTVCYVENNAYCQKVIQARIRDGCLDDAPIWDDVKTFNGQPWAGRVDIIFGGFPCQDVSIAGKRAGITGARSGLWKEFARIICEIRPQYAFIENVPGLIAKGFDVLLCDLAEIGYDARWTTLSAAEVGAPHKRERLWILAYAEGTRRPTRPRKGQSRRQSKVADARCDGSEPKRIGGISTGTSREMQEQMGKQRFRVDTCNSGQDVVNPAGKGLRDWAGETVGQPHPLTEFERPSGREIERDFCGISYGVHKRVDRLKALGNAVVPLQAKTAFEYLITAVSKRG